MKSFVTGALVGVGLVYFFEPSKGGERRTSTGNKLSGLTGAIPGVGGKSSSNSGTQSNGASTSGGLSANSGSSTGSSTSGAGATRQHDNDNPDDKTLTDRIESEIFANEETSREFINVNVVDGVAVLRGEQPTQQAIDALIGRVKSIRGVKDVQSYLHLPNTVAPNKESAINAS